MFDKIEYDRRYYQEHAEEEKEHSRQWYDAHAEEVKASKKEYRANRTLKQIRRQLDAQMKSRQKLKFEVLLHYTRVFDPTATEPRCNDPFHKHLPNDPMLTDIRVQTIDHINGGGSKERKEAKGDLYRKLKQRGYPKGYQDLCMNCQYIKRHENKEIPRHL